MAALNTNKSASSKNHNKCEYCENMEMNNNAHCNGNYGPNAAIMSNGLKMGAKKMIPLPELAYPRPTRPSIVNQRFPPVDQCDTCLKDGYEILLGMNGKNTTNDYDSSPPMSDCCCDCDCNSCCDGSLEPMRRTQSSGDIMRDFMSMHNEQQQRYQGECSDCCCCCPCCVKTVPNTNDRLVATMSQQQQQQQINGLPQLTMFNDNTQLCDCKNNSFNFLN